MAKTLLTLRLPDNVISGLKRLALIESVRRDRQTSWVKLLTEIAERRLADESITH